jgi:hypothetical protein
MFISLLFLGIDDHLISKEKHTPGSDKSTLSKTLEFPLLAPQKQKKRRISLSITQTLQRSKILPINHHDGDYSNNNSNCSSRSNGSEVSIESMDGTWLEKKNEIGAYHFSDNTYLHFRKMQG